MASVKKTETASIIKKKIESKTHEKIIKDQIEDNNLENSEKQITDTTKNTSKNISTDTELYKNVILEEFIYLKPIDLNNKIDDIILRKLQRKIEGKCIKIGYVIPNSIKIVMRSLGIINNANFDGITTYKVKYTADICNPAKGQVIQCVVGNIDKSQVICYIDTPEKSPVEIYLFKHHHLGNIEFSQLEKGDTINVKIGGSKWEYRDRQIISIAQYINKA
jgi:DNA-directed RNA polymerase subunit E'/Rpb7